MHLSRSMVATLAVLGATCALPAIAASQAATPAPKAGTYDDAKASVDLRVAKDRRTIAFIDGSCFVHHVQVGVWKVSKHLTIAHGAIAFDGPLKVLLVSATNARPTKTLQFKVRARFMGGRFNGTVSTTTPAQCETRRFSAKFLAHPDA